MKHRTMMNRMMTVLLIGSVLLTAGCGRSLDGAKQPEASETQAGSEDTETDGDSVQTWSEDTEADGTSVQAGAVDTEPDSNEDTYSRTADMQDLSTVTDPETLQTVIDLAEEAKEQTVFEYADFTAEDLIAETAAVYQMAHDGGYVYGDSQTTPPCEDGFISCDRLIARALWNLGLTDQIEKGMNVGVEVQYLTTHGFELVTDQSKLSAGDIVMQDNGVSGRPNWKWHTFLLVSYDPDTTMCVKYDCGHFTADGVDRVSSEQPFICPLADYGTQRRFVCGFHLREKPSETGKAVLYVP